MFLLFVGTSDVAQIGLEMSLESMQLLTPLVSVEQPEDFYRDGPARAKLRRPLMVRYIVDIKQLSTR